MHRIVDIYFVGGFGTVQWIDPADFTGCKPDAIVLDKPQRTLAMLNEACAAVSSPLRTIVSLRRSTS